MLNIQFASFWALPSDLSGFSSFILEPVNVPGPFAAGTGGAGGAGGAGGGACCAAVYIACQCFTTSSIRSFAIYTTLSET